MANTFTQIHIQFVIAVRNRAALINPAWKEELHRYITGIFQKNQHRMIQINSVSDHMHIFVGIRPHQSISSVIQNVKTESTKWIKHKHLPEFAWQEGYGAFSYARSEVRNVACYIQDQENHHKKETFRDEYKRLLHEFHIDYKEWYLFDEII
jgi:putative transposase